MDLDSVIVEIRPRGRWEAMDLGVPLARACARALWGAWLVTWLPVAIALGIGLRDRLALAALVLWWLKPVFDRVALHVLSRTVFGATPGVGETLRAMPRAMRRGLIAALTWMRFDAARSFNLPLWQLEELRGARFRRRMRLLEAAMRRPAGWLTVICVTFEGVIVAGLFAFGAWMIPPQLLDAAGMALVDSGGLVQVAAFAAWVLAVAAVEPFYVAAGFTLYLNRRTVLEAWDLEIAFRRIAGRVHAERRAAA